METLTLLSFGLVVIVVLLSVLITWAPRKFWVKVVGFMTILAFLVFGFTSMAELLGLPKPIKLEWFKKSTPEAKVLWAKIVEGKEILLLLEVPKKPKPEYYTMPYDFEFAKQLQKALEEGKKHGTVPRVRLPFEWSWENREPKFYALPQPALPPKQAPIIEPQQEQQENRGDIY